MTTHFFQNVDVVQNVVCIMDRVQLYQDDDVFFFSIETVSN
jgi:hypothetical protein